MRTSTPARTATCFGAGPPLRLRLATIRQPTTTTNTSTGIGLAITIVISRTTLTSWRTVRQPPHSA